MPDRVNLPKAGNNTGSNWQWSPQQTSSIYALDIWN